MKKWLMYLGLGALTAALIVMGHGYYKARSMGFFRAPVYESVAPAVPELVRPAVLVFSKTNSFIHKEAIPAAQAMFQALAEKNGWSIYITDNGAIHNPEDLARFDTIVWNNVTGNVLTQAQQQALVTYLQSGGGWVGIHGSGDSSSNWGWYNETLIGATFIGHPMDPQFQQATVDIEQPADPIVDHLGSEWIRVDEWYSFAESPRSKGFDILATLDESSYSPWFGKKDMRMGEDHPIVWKHCLQRGRVFYSAMGHTAESYAEPRHIEMLKRAVAWTAGLEGTHCEPGNKIGAAKKEIRQ